MTHWNDDRPPPPMTPAEKRLAWVCLAVALLMLAALAILPGADLEPGHTPPSPSWARSSVSTP